MMVFGKLKSGSTPQPRMWMHAGQDSPQDIIAILYCPGKHRLELSGLTHGIAPDGLVIGTVTCLVHGCWRESGLRLHDWAQPGSKFYAVATEKYVDGYWRAEIVYCHALDEVNARFLVLQASKGERLRIVAIGPVIGYNVDDATGSKLSV